MATRRNVLSCMALAWVAPATVAHAQAWPTRPVKLVLPFPPGGATDRLARLYANALSSRLGQPVVVDNRPGATGAVAAASVLASPADGYTLLLSFVSGAVLLPLLNKKLPYSPAELLPVASLVSYDFVLVAGPAVKAVTLTELLEQGRRDGNAPTYGSIGAGSAPHLVMENLNAAAGTRLRHVPYKGEQPMLQDLFGGHLDTALLTLTVAEPLMQAGSVRALALTSPQRAVSAPTVPTLAELGYPNASFTAWGGVFARKGMPDAARQTLESGTRELMASSSMVADLRAAGFTPEFRDSAEFTRFIASESVRYERWIKQAGLTPQD
jgi:tripartite-type tricarboxylate transporter receptor subunit TctC